MSDFLFVNKPLYSTMMVRRLKVKSEKKRDCGKPVRNIYFSTSSLLYSVHFILSQQKNWLLFGGVPGRGTGTCLRVHKGSHSRIINSCDSDFICIYILICFVASYHTDRFFYCWWTWISYSIFWNFKMNRMQSYILIVLRSANSAKQTSKVKNPKEVPGWRL